MGENIDIERVTMRFGDFAAVRDVTLTVHAGEFFSFLGPSGCGKTTLLRLISGFIEPSEGSIRIAGRDMRGIGPNKRPTALIFQNLALFPLMTVAENIGFGLEVRGVAKAVRRKRAAELLELVAMPEAIDKKVSELSGGQRQRVAVARALAVEPKVMLLDEPLSALDLKLRQHMRTELRAIQRRTGVTFIYITHDQSEALTMSDRVGVMSRGLIQQIAAPQAIYDDPATSFVASFVGENNPIRGRVTAVSDELATVETALGPLTGRNGQGLQAGASAILFVRPERLALLAPGDPPPGNVIAGTVGRSAFEGNFATLFVRSRLEHETALQAPNDGSLPDLKPDSPVRIGFAPESAVVLAQGELARE